MTMPRVRLRDRQEGFRGSLPAFAALPPPPREERRTGHPRPQAPLLYWRPVLIATAFTTLFIGTIVAAGVANTLSRKTARQTDTTVATVPEATPTDSEAADPPLLDEKPLPAIHRAVVRAEVAAPVRPAVKQEKAVPKELTPEQLQPVAREVAPPDRPDSVPEPPAPQPVAPAPVPPPVVVKAPPGTETFGTSVVFVRTPLVAARQAREQQKLLFILHVSGDFEEACFT